MEDLKQLVASPLEEQMVNGIKYTPDPESVDTWKAHGVIDFDRLINHQIIKLDYNTEFNLEDWNRMSWNGHSVIFQGQIIQPDELRAKKSSVFATSNI